MPVIAGGFFHAEPPFLYLLSVYIRGNFKIVLKALYFFFWSRKHFFASVVSWLLKQCSSLQRIFKYFTLKLSFTSVVSINKAYS